MTTVQVVDGSAQALLCRRKPPPAALVQNRIERLVPRSDRRVVNHPPIL